MSHLEPVCGEGHSLLPMPPGTYFGLVGNLRPCKAGLTSAMLRRYELINERFADSADNRRMTLLTLSGRDKDDVESYSLTDGVDVLNVERHGNRVKSECAWIDWLAELSAIATAEDPVYFICDGHEVGAVVVESLRPLPHVFFIQVVHNPTRSAKYADFRRSAEYADAIVCATNRQAKALISDERHGGKAHGKVPVYDIGFPRRSAGAKQTERNERRIIMLTRVHWQKDISLAVESFHELMRLAESSGLEGRSDLVLDIYGALEDAGEVARSKVAIDSYNLQGKVKLHGYTSGAFEELGSSSITWLTSRFEGWGLAITEAQQSGCIPVVVDEPFGPREQIEHGKDGFLVRSHAARWLRHQEDKKKPGRKVRAMRKVGRRVITSLPVQVARETLRVLEMDAMHREDIRLASIERVGTAQRSPETYIDNWIDVIEKVGSQARRV